MLYKKKRLFFISKKIQLIQKSYNQQCHPLHLRREQYKQLPQKGRKEKKNLKKGKGKDKKRECEREKKKEKEKENEKEEEKGKEEKKKEEKMKRAVLKVF